MPNPLCIIAIAAALSAGCSSMSQISAVEPSAPPSPARGQTPDSVAQADAAAAATRSGKPLAYINGRPVGWDQMGPLMLEAAGGTVLTQIVLDRQVERRLAERGLKLTDAQIGAERSILRRTLHPDPDQGQRLLDGMRQRRGLGKRRFQAMLKRQAGLRLLVQDEVQISDAAVQQAYERQYGKRYELRLIVSNSPAQASQLAEQARQGANFADLAARFSTDSSRQQGGYLGLVSRADPTWPTAVRDALGRLAEGQISDPIALDDGFAVIRVERIVPGSDVPIEQVRDEMQRQVRRQVESMRMRQLAAALLERADVVVLDAELNRSWQNRPEMQP